MKFCFYRKDFIEQHIDGQKMALTDAQRTISWLAFEQEVNEICNYIKNNKLDTLPYPIILYGHKQIEMITCMYACIKCNIPYIPIDIIVPKERIIRIQNISQAQVVFNCTQHPLNIDKTAEFTVQKTSLITTQECKDLAFEQKIREKNPLIYIIFTSGSTGEPKGVQISTESIQSFTKWMCSDFNFSSQDVFINIAILSFDLSVYEVMSFGALGAGLVLNDTQTTENSEKLIQRIEQNKGTVWVSTPSFALAYARMIPDQRLTSIAYFLFCGETLPHATAQNLQKNFPKAIIYNTYGPTEATVATTLVTITQEILEKYNPLPVGFPKPGSIIDIQKENEEDKTGEIIIVGDHVSVGYLHRDDLNKEKFIQKHEQRAFKTGDLGYIEHGMLFCQGRNDDQVKLNGYRIELNEISAVLQTFDSVIEATTVGLRRNNEVKKIISFVICEKTLKIDNNVLKDQLLQKLRTILPPYMIPGDLVLVDHFPYSANVKIDKKKLSEDYIKEQLG
jgi:D-alanine--poly(phosphoribitol) ligase subunit 1